MNRLLQDRVLYEKVRDNCRKAGKVLNWEKEEQHLLAFYQQVFPPRI